MGDVDLKLSRAEHHRDDLASLLRDFRARRPYQVGERTDDWRGRPYRVHFAGDLEPVPEDAALIFGDVVQNLRATLDYLIGELRPGGPTGLSQFPICNTTECFKSAVDSDLAGVPADIVAVIERMQAYGPSPERTGYDQWPDDLKARELYRPLRWLHTLWNIDKHRALAVASGWVVPAWASHNRSPEESAIGLRVDQANGRAEWSVPIDEGDPYLDAHYEVRVDLLPPDAGHTADWPVGVTELEIDELAKSLCHSVRWNVLRELGQYRPT